METEFLKPTVEYFHLSPLLVVFAGACLGILLEAFLPRARRLVVQVPFTALVLALALVLTVVVAAADEPKVAAMGSVAVDGPVLYLWGLLLVLALLGVLLFAERRLDGGLSAFAGQIASVPGSDAEQAPARARWEQSEVYPLFLFAVTGALLLPAASDLLVMFIGLEILSLPLYLLCASARRRRLLSQEAALKYFLLGAFSSAFLLYGIALLYGYAGSTSYGAISAVTLLDADNDVLLLCATGLLLVGLFFKVGAAPFHAWTPDVYQGAPTPLVAFMSAATKVAAFGAMIRLLHVALGEVSQMWAPAVYAVALLSMVVGTVFALTQDDVKRLLAYSSVAHAGFVLAGVLGLQVADAGEGALKASTALLFYLTSYAFTSLGAFACVWLVRDGGGEVASLERWRGLGKESPWVAAIFGFFMLALAGIPLTSGFVGKWTVFESAGAAGAWPLVVAAVLLSAVAAAFYVRVIGLMFFADPDERTARVSRPSALTLVVLGVAVALTLVLGLVPDPLLDLVAGTGEWLG